MKPGGRQRQHRILAGMLSLFLFVTASAPSALADGGKTIYLKWKSQLSARVVGTGWRTGSSDLDAALAHLKLRGVRPAIQQALPSDPCGLKLVLHLDLDDAEDLPACLARLRGLKGTAYAEPSPVRMTSDWPTKAAPCGIDDVPGDPLYGEQWFYPLLQAPAAWDLTHSDASVVVAIVDNGTDWNHPDLSDNIWSNPGEIDGNGIDDDQNGFIDDVRGWDFYDMDNNPAPESSGNPPQTDYHGTHTAGLVGALMNNGRGVVGMAPSCKVMPVRTGYGSTINYGLEGIVYAAHNGADIISLSWGGAYSNSYEQDVINDARQQGCLIIAAAGNEGTSSLHYPAAYEGVMAVAATTPNDAKASFSNYGAWISVCAPGLSILSLIPNGYGTADGTSMSTPIVAGVAALVKALHASWSAEQISAQIVFTADNIAAKNPLYDGLLGSGRVNAYRALTETAPGLQIENLNVAETSGDFDGKLDPGESGSLTLSLKNFGSTTFNVQILCFSGAPDVQVQQSVWTVPQISAGATVNNSSSPFLINVSSFAQINNAVTLLFNVNAESFYSAPLTAPIWISPAFASHDTGNVVFTLTNFGAFGYQNYMNANSPYGGSGFRFPADSSNALYHGSLVAGVDYSRVSDCAYGGSFAYEARYDWQSTANGDIQIYPGAVADQEGTAMYKDSGAPADQRVGLAVVQHSYAWSSPSNNDYVIVAFDLKNISGAPLSDLYVGLYMDWDLIFHYDNEANWDGDRSLGYVYNEFYRDPNRRYYGTSLLTGSLKSYRVIDLYGDVPSSGVMTDSIKYSFMSAGMVKTASILPSDQATLLSAGPFALADSDSVLVAFAVLGGEDLTALRNSADAALAAWNVLSAAHASAPLGQPFTIESVFPRPGNSSLNVSFSLPGAGEVNFALVDLLGRTMPIWREALSQAGLYRFAVEKRDLASGVYWLVGSSPYGNSTMKIVWLK